jgi:hypothetical protein
MSNSGGNLMRRFSVKHTQSLMFWTCLQCLIVSGFLPNAVRAEDTEADPSLRITVQVDNYSPAPSTVLARAEREAGRILDQAGVQVVWLECRLWPSTDDPQGHCQKAPEATNIRVRVLPAPVDNGIPNTVFGFAVHPVLAIVHYEYVVRLATSDNDEFELPIILGCVIAHEIGHLLLGPNSHSSPGIMQPRWKRKQVQQLMMGALLFTSDQSKLIQTEVRTRMRLQTGIHVKKIK